MAKVNYGPIVTSASGKVAGIVFSIWKGVSYIKRWVKPTYTNTTLQQAIRDGFAALTQLWKYLPASVVLAWTDYVKGKPMSNRNAYIGANVVDYAVPTIGQLTPHNPTVFPPITFNVTTATALELRGHITYPPDTTTNDQVYMTCIRKDDKKYLYSGTVVFPATQVAVDVGIALAHYCHAYIAATIDHQRSMSLGKIAVAT